MINDLIAIIDRRTDNCVGITTKGQKKVFENFLPDSYLLYGMDDGDKSLWAGAILKVSPTQPGDYGELTNLQEKYTFLGTPEEAVKILQEALKKMTDLVTIYSRKTGECEGVVTPALAKVIINRLPNTFIWYGNRGSNNIPNWANGLLDWYEAIQPQVTRLKILTGRK